MALLTVKSRLDLGSKFVLAPERYDPRREALRAGSPGQTSVPLGTLVRSIRQSINPSKKPNGDRQYLVYDTSDVREGLLIGRKKPVPLADIGSLKKVFQQGDVIISRLRPYLRQVAFIDSHVGDGCSAELVCSTEFFVLRSLTDDPIAFLVPYLLSPQVQSVLAASQEGGHHPRFDEETLMMLPVPQSLVANREASSSIVAGCAAKYRESEQSLIDLIAQAENATAAQSK